MSKFGKTILGALTLFPIAHILFFMFMVFGSMNSPWLLADGNNFSILMVSHLSAMLTIFGLMIFYVVHALKNLRLESNERLMWALIIFVGNTLAMPIYFWFHILPDRSAELV